MARRDSVMSRMELEGAIIPSLLDRLTQDDDEPRRAAPSGNASRTFESDKARYIQSVNRDLEMLLNTRRTIVEVSEQYPQLRDSVFTFGLPDVSGIAVNTPAGRDRLRLALAEAIERHEPRLMNVRVREATEVGDSIFGVRFSIEAVLCLSVGKIEVSFDTVLQPGTGAYEVLETDAGSLR